MNLQSQQSFLVVGWLACHSWTGQWDTEINQHYSAKIEEYIARFLKYINADIRGPLGHHCVGCCPGGVQETHREVSKRRKVRFLKISILRKLLEQKRVARNCSKLLEAARRRALSSSLVQHLFAERCSSSFLRILVFKMLVFFLFEVQALHYPPFPWQGMRGICHRQSFQRCNHQRRCTTQHVKRAWATANECNLIS